MNRRLIVLSMALAFCPSLPGQNYTFTHTTETYTDLTGATVISSTFWGIGDWIPYKMPFDFKFFGTVQDSMYIIGGWAGLNMHGSGFFQDGEIYFCDADLHERGVGGPSDISVAVTGTAPNRVFKLQLRNAGFYYDQSANEDDFINVQLWIHESTGVIEIRFGLSSVSPATYDPYNGPTVALILDFTTYITLSGDANSPTAFTGFPSLEVNGTPSNGKVYRFTPSAVGIGDITPTEWVTVFPNPSADRFTITLNESLKGDALQAEVTDLQGRVLLHRQNVESHQPWVVDLTGSPQGMYLLRVTSEEGVFSKQLMVR